MSRPLRGRNCNCSCLWFWLWCFTAGCHVESPLFPQPPPPPSKRSGIHDGRKHACNCKTVVFHNPPLSANKQVVHICRSLLSAAADVLADGSGERRTSPFNRDAQSGNGVDRSPSRAVVHLAVSATTFPTALSLYIAQGRLRKESAIYVVLKGRTVAI